MPSRREQNLNNRVRVIEFERPGDICPVDEELHRFRNEIERARSFGARLSQGLPGSWRAPPPWDTPARWSPPSEQPPDQVLAVVQHEQHLLLTAPTMLSTIDIR